MEKLWLIQVYMLHVSEWNGCYSAWFLGCQMRFLAIFEFFGDALSRIFEIFKNEYPNRQ